jgi:hypothetical protein
MSPGGFIFPQNEVRKVVRQAQVSLAATAVRVIPERDLVRIKLA